MLFIATIKRLIIVMLVFMCLEIYNFNRLITSIFIPSCLFLWKLVVVVVGGGGMGNEFIL